MERRQKYPNLEIHASTQCHNHNKEIISLWKNLGLTRVVFAREMSLEEIKNIADLEHRVLPHDEFIAKWDNWCDGMQEAVLFFNDN